MRGGSNPRDLDFLPATCPTIACSTLVAYGRRRPVRDAAAFSEDGEARVRRQGPYPRQGKGKLALALRFFLAVVVVVVVVVVVAVERQPRKTVSIVWSKSPTDIHTNHHVRT